MSNQQKIPFVALVLAAIFLIALGLRLFLIFLQPGIFPYYVETTYAGDAARNMVEGRGYVIDQAYDSEINGLIEKNQTLVDIQDVKPPADEQFEPFYGWPPGTAVLTAITYKIFNSYRYIYVRILQAIIDSTGCLIIFLLGQVLFNRRVGLVASMLYALWLPVAFLSTWVLVDALMPFFALVILYFFVMGVKKGSLKYYILAGLSCGIACYFQVSVQFLPVFLGIGLLVYSLRKSEFQISLARSAKATAIMLGVMLILITPWIVRNSALRQSFTGMRPNTWSALWEFSGEFGDSPDGAELDDTRTYLLAAKSFGYDLAYQSPEFEQFFRVKLLDQIRDHPLWYLSLSIRRLPRALCNFAELGIDYLPQVGSDYKAWLYYLYGSSGIGDYRKAINGVGSGLSNGTVWPMAAQHPFGAMYLALVCLFALAPPLLTIIMFIVLRKDWRNLLLAAIIPFYFIAFHMFTMVASFKSMVPANIGYILFCSLAIVFIYERFHKARSS